jgi:hypothetical protein
MPILLGEIIMQIKTQHAQTRSFGHVPTVEAIITAPLTKLEKIPRFISRFLVSDHFCKETYFYPTIKAEAPVPFAKHQSLIAHLASSEVIPGEKTSSPKFPSVLNSGILKYIQPIGNPKPTKTLYRLYLLFAHNNQCRFNSKLLNGNLNFQEPATSSPQIPIIVSPRLTFRPLRKPKITGFDPKISVLEHDTGIHPHCLADIQIARINLIIPPCIGVSNRKPIHSLTFIIFPVQGLC